MLADAAGLGDDLDALFVNDAEPLAAGRARRLSDDETPEPVRLNRRQLLQSRRR